MSEMENEMIETRGITGAASLLIGLSSASAPADQAPTLAGSFPIVELRQYTLHEGKRDTLIQLFEREFVESQEAVGMQVVGTFIDVDRPNRFVWIRGFKDMKSRENALTAFYDGPVWRAHRDEANATMIDSDNVLLLRAPGTNAEFNLTGLRPKLDEQVSAGLIVATVYHLSGSPDVALGVFETQVKPQIMAAGVTPLAWFVPETGQNNFPRLPVREGEHVLVWFARFDSELDHARHTGALAKATEALRPSLEGNPEVLRLRPTARSQLR